MNVHTNARKPGQRHPLLLYRRAMDRLWKPTLLLGLILAAASGWALISPVPLFRVDADVWLFVGALVSLAFSLFTFLMRRMGYVQAFPTYFVIVTPFLRLKVSYRRVRSIHPGSFQQLFPPAELKWGARNYLAPFFSYTAVVVDLSAYPLNRSLLKLFLPAQMFSPRSTGLVLLVPDWMALSTELDSLRSTSQKAPVHVTSISHYGYKKSA